MLFPFVRLNPLSGYAGKGMDMKKNQSLSVIEKMADILMEEANAEITQLRNERDEARREVCRMLNGRGGWTAEEHASIRKWDCFIK